MKQQPWQRALIGLLLATMLAVAVAQASALTPLPSTGTDPKAAAAAADDAGQQQQPFEPTARSISAVVIAFLVASLAASAGVGGGAFFVPLFITLLGFGLKDATVLSQCTIAAVSAASILFNLPKRHPERPDQTLIAYPQLNTMTPALLAGVGIGVIANAAFPTWLITTMLITLLAYMSVRTTQKGLQQWRSESARKRAAAAAAAAAATASDSAASEGASEGDALLGGSAAAAPQAVVVITDSSAAPGQASASKAGPAPYPWGMAAGVVFLWLGFAALQLLRQNTVKCSPAFYGVIAGQVVFGAVSSAMFAYFCLAKPAREAEGAAGLAAPLLANSSVASLSGLLERQAHHQQADMGHLMGTALKVAVAGMVAGVVGIGGGLIMGPLLLGLGLHPQSTAATSNVLVFMCSSSAAVAFLLEGRVQLHYAAVFCSVCGIASLLGLSVVGRLVQASGRPSIVVLLLSFIMAAGGLCSGVFGYLDAWQHGDTGFKSIC